MIRDCDNNLMTGWCSAVTHLCRESHKSIGGFVVVGVFFGADPIKVAEESSVIAATQQKKDGLCVVKTSDSQKWYRQYKG